MQQPTPNVEVSDHRPCIRFAIWQLLRVLARERNCNVESEKMCPRQTRRWLVLTVRKEDFCAIGVWSCLVDYGKGSLFSHANHHHSKYIFES